MTPPDPSSGREPDRGAGRPTSAWKRAMLRQRWSRIQGHLDHMSADEFEDFAEVLDAAAEEKVRRLTPSKSPVPEQVGDCRSSCPLWTEALGRFAALADDIDPVSRPPEQVGD